MRKIGILGLVGVLALFLAGCGGGDDRNPVIHRAVGGSPTPTVRRTADPALASSTGNVSRITVAAGGTSPRTPGTHIVQILSDQPVDGDIGFTAPATFVISQANVTSERSVRHRFRGDRIPGRFSTSPSTDPPEAGWSR